MSDNRPNVYTEGDKTIFRASALGSCTSALAYEYAGIESQPPPEWLFKSFEEGNRMEAHLLEKLGGELHNPVQLSKYGAVGEDGQVETELAFANTIIRCHPDGIITRNEALYVAEVKFVGVNLWDLLTDDIKLVPRYAWQASIEMLTTGLPLLYGVGLKDAETRELVGFKSHVYTEPPYTLGQVRARVAKIIQIGKKGLAGEEVPWCDQKNFPCGVWHMHRDDDPMWKRDEIILEGDDAAIFNELYAEIVEARALENHAKDLKKSATNEYNKLVKKYDVEGSCRIGSADHSVTHVVTTRNTTDWKQLCQDLQITEATLKKYQKTSTSSYPKMVPPQPRL